MRSPTFTSAAAPCCWMSHSAIQVFSSGTPAVTSFGSQSTIGYDWGAGFAFSPNTNVFIVTSLGYFGSELSFYDDSQVQVSLLNSSSTVLASALISSNDTLRNQTYYENISPISLTLGQTYYIEATNPATGLWIGHVGIGVVAAPQLHYIGMAYSTNDAGVFPATVASDAPSYTFFGANFEFTTVPEPSAPLIGLVSVLYFYRRLRCSA